jgi:hypothetical protein
MASFSITPPGLAPPFSAARQLKGALIRPRPRPYYLEVRTFQPPGDAAGVLPAVAEEQCGPTTSTCWTYEYHGFNVDAAVIEEAGPP